VILTKLFGDISIDEFRRKVIAPTGIHQTTLGPEDNCASWIIESYMHMFLFIDRTLGWEVEGVSAQEFARRVIEGNTTLWSYPLDQIKQ
jgi:hypothetical protein